MYKNLTKQDYFDDPTLPLQIYLRDPQLEFPAHKHSFDELAIILKGTANHVIDDQHIPVKSGDVFVVSKSHKHQYIDMNGLALANLLFDGDALEISSWDIRSLPGFHALFALEPILRRQQKFTSHLRLIDSQLSHATDLLHKLTHETTHRNPGYRVMAKGLFMQLVVFLSRCYSEEPTGDSVDLLRIGDAIAHIETNFAQKITLDELAKKAHLSTRHFQRIFQECIGRAPIDHLLHVRIRKAAERLRQTNDSITEIAFHVGFNDSNYFSRQFRVIMNQTPRQYKMNQKEISK